MRAAARSIATMFLGCLVLLGTVAFAQESSEKKTQDSEQSTPAWEKEFNDLCSKTQDAMTFSATELKTLVERCDQLQPKIDKLDDTRKKVYTKRLGQCRGLYAYVLESKSKSNEKK